MRHSFLHKLQRILLWIGFIAVIWLAAAALQILGFAPESADGIPPQRFVWAAFGSEIALISGHSGNDSGATCETDDGKVQLAEVDLISQITQMVEQRLRRAGATVTILQEYDRRLEGLQADALLSLHADSCVDVSGYKAARGIYSQIPTRDDRLVACIDQIYSIATKLAIHHNSVTHNMTEYHAFRRIHPSTPSAILEIGFLGGDQKLLTEQQPLIAKAIADSLICFLQNS